MSWRVIHDTLLLGRCFRGFVLPVLEYYSAVWCSAADTRHKLLNCVVSDASFRTGGVFECHMANRRSVSVLCMLYKVSCNQCTLFMVLYLDRMCQSGSHAVLWSHIGIIIRFLAAEPRSTATVDLYSHLSVAVERSCWPRTQLCGTGGFQEQSNPF